MLPIAGVLFLASFLAPGGAFATGWTSYAPLASEQPFGQVFFNMGVQWAGASSIATALNFLVTIITMRAPGMTFWRMPLLVWANFTTSLLVVIATPFIAGSQFFVMFDRVMHTSFFTPDNGGYVLGYQHIFWFYSHPAVYIMILPGFGIISEIISVMSRKPIFGYRLMAISLLGILVLGFSVWAHHMFVAGMADWLRVPMMISTLLIAVPTGVKVFSWLATLWEGKIHLNTPMLFALGFVSMFVIGGLSGIYLAAVPIDIHASDTYFIVAHIHYVLFGGSVFTIFAGIYYWFPKMTGRMYNERLGKLHFWITFVAFNVTFFPMHWVGLVGMPRRVADYAGTFGALNMVVSIASFALGASVVDLRLQRDHELGARADRGLEPVAGDDDRVAGQLARRRCSTSTRSRRSSAARTSTACPARSTPSCGAARCRRHACERERARAQAVVLVVANETLVGDELLDAVRERAAEGPIRTVVVAPVNEPSAGYVVYRNSRRASAGRRVDRMVASLRAAGIPAHGDVFEGGPIAAVEDILALEDIDELIVSTHPEETSGWLRKKNVLSELRRLAGDRPFEHVVSDVAARTGQANVLVIANETVLGERLLDRIRARAAEGPAAFLIVCPQSDPDAGEHPEAERRLRAALDAPRRGHRGARADRAPRPVHGRDAGDRGRAGRRGDRLDVPGRALRLAAARRRRAPAQGRRRPGRARRRRRRPAVGGRLVSAHAEAAPTTTAHHGPPPANKSARLDSATLGMFLFIASEAMLFGAFFTAYFFVRVVNPDAPATWPPPPYEFPVFVASRQHGDPRDVELHDPLGDAVDQARRPERPQGGARRHDPARPRLPAHAGDRVRPRRLQHERRRVRLGLLRPDGPPRRARLRRAVAAHDRRPCAPSAATSRPTTTTASRSPGSTGTSST